MAQIVAETMPELPEDDGRAELASLLEYAERKCVDLIEHPGYALTAQGRVAEDPDGNPLTNKQVVDNAIRTLMLIAERKARTFGWDKQQKRETPLDEARRQMGEVMAQIAARKAAEDAQRELSAADRRELEMLRQQVGHVIPGEVLAELPPGA